MGKKKISAKETTDLLDILAKRFEKNKQRHPSMEWNDVLKKINKSPGKLWSLQQMELTGGEPDVIAFDKKKGEYLFCDCAAESPAGRRSLCYDKEALASRKEHKPKDSIMNLAETMGIDVLDEVQYRTLQQLGKFDQKTSSWIRTPNEIRKHGGALFCDRRYEHVFTYHNGAESYYAARGFRGLLKV